MKNEIRNILETRMGKFFNDLSPDSFIKDGSESSQRFWNLFRNDLMRKKPKEVRSYLLDSKSKLLEKYPFAIKLADEFFEEATSEEDLRMNQEALLFACLEIDAALKIKGIDLDQERKNSLSKKLKLWRDGR